MKNWHTGRDCVVAVCFCLGVSVGCAPTLSKTPMQLRGDAWQAFRAVDAAREVESSNPQEAIQVYEKSLQEEAKFGQPFRHYQTILQGALSEMQGSSGRQTLSEEAALGFPDVFARHLLTTVKAHQGIGRAHAVQGHYPEAEKHATEAVEIMAKRAHAPFFQLQSHIESYQLLQDVHIKQGKVGRALMAKLSVDLLRDHLESKGGADDFFVEKALFYGEAAQNQFASVDQFVSGVNQQRIDQHNAQIMAVTGGMMAVNAALQSSMASSALAQSGGVMTPQVQMAQMNAQIAQMQSQVFMALVAAQVEATPKTLQANSTPWAIPTFSQQLVDPKQGANTPTIMKGFAINAAQVGGGSYQAGAQQVTQAVDALTPYRQFGKTEGAAAQVDKFAQVFNSFLTQVQEITAVK